MLLNLVYIFISNNIINQHYRKVSLDSAIVYIIIWLARGGQNFGARGKRGGQNFSVRDFQKWDNPPTHKFWPLPRWPTINDLVEGDKNALLQGKN